MWKQTGEKQKKRKEKKNWKENGIWIFGANSYSSMLFRYFFFLFHSFSLSLHGERIVLLGIASVAHVYVFHYMRYVYTNEASHFGIYFRARNIGWARFFFFLYFFFGSLLRSSTDLSVFRVENLLIRFSIQLTTNVYRCALVFGEHFLNSNRCRIRTKHLMRSNILIVWKFQSIYQISFNFV